MARKSRKKDTAMEVPVPVAKEKVYSAALYARISVENDHKREVDSIGTQIQLLKDFASEHLDMEVFDIYCDDDITGTNFERPEFSRMMVDIRDGKVNCVIVKDLSRLGRNYIESGEYIEMVFPFLGVRFIAVTDRFDSKYQQADISVQLRNMANEMYAKDISKKICSSMRSIQEQGKFAGSKAPYGYLLDPDDKHHLIIDPETAPIVKEMFEMLADGCTQHYIATTLEARGIPSPGRVLYNRGVVQADKFKNSHWYMQTVHKILIDQIYLGWMVSGKFRSDYYTTGQKGSKPVPKEEWIITKGTHEPIVTEALFNEAQKYFEDIQKDLGMVSKPASKSKLASIFKGHLRCGECGQAMFFRHKNNHGRERTWWYYCALHENYNSSYCIKKAVKKDDVESVALKLIKMQMQLFTEARSMILSLNKKESSKTKYRILCDQIQTVKRQINSYMEQKAALYESVTNGSITQEDYFLKSQEWSKKADELRVFLKELEDKAEQYSLDYSMQGNWAKLIEKYQNTDQLTAEMVDAFIDQMYMFNDGHVEITFNFKDEMDEVIYLSAIRQKEAQRYAV